MGRAKLGPRIPKSAGAAEESSGFLPEKVNSFESERGASLSSLNLNACY